LLAEARGLPTTLAFLFPKIAIFSPIYFNITI